MFNGTIKTAEKEFKFESAHRLINYNGKCKNLHGHSYITKVVLALATDATLNEHGFVKDYGDFKPFKDWIDDNLDHATIVSIHDSKLMLALDKLGSKKFVLNKPNSSAEYLCELFFEKAKELLEDESVFVFKVIIKETCTSEATIGFN